MTRQTFKTGARWEAIVGYSRAVRVGRIVHVAGTTATDENSRVVGIGDAYAQAVQALRNIERGLKGVGADFADVVRTRMFIVNIAENWEAVGRAHGEIFRDIQPASTMVEVSGLIQPEMLVEIEVDAIVDTD